MKIWEFDLKIYVKQDIKHDDALAEITRLIDYTLVRTEEDNAHHKSNAFKFYSHGNLCPIETTKVYKAGNLYSAVVRTVDENTKNKLLAYSIGQESVHFKVVDRFVKCLTEQPINKLYTLTGVVVTFKDVKGYWKGQKSRVEYFQSLQANLIHKYEKFTGEKIPVGTPIFKSISILTTIPVVCKIKNVRLAADKVEVDIASNPYAQKLAWFAIATGLGEKNSRGCGYVGYKQEAIIS